MSKAPKNDLIKEAKRNGYDDAFLKIGIVVDALYASQISYLATYEANRWLRHNIGANISMFFSEHSPVSSNTEFARFHMRDAFGFDGHLIATSFKTALFIKNIYTAKRYYYINDMEWLRNFRHSRQSFDQIMKDNTIVKFTRCQDYYKHMTEQGLSINKNIVEDFNMGQILEIINGSH